MSGPGVFVEESQPSPIVAAPTSVPAFLGITGGSLDPALVTSSADFARSWPRGTPVATALELYFRGGGQVAWVAPLASIDAAETARGVTELHPDVSLIAVVAEPPAPAEVIAAAVDALAGRRAVVLAEGPWTDAASAVAGESAWPRSRDLALYWPRGLDAGGAVVSVLGAVCALIARTDAARGVFVAPAGADATLVGIRSPAIALTRSDADDLNTRNVDTLREFGASAAGTVVWGARTRALDPEWKYVNVRRLCLFVEESIERSLSWAVFEPNSDPLWRTVRVCVEEFLLDLFGRGALQGATPRDAFFVRAGRDTTTQTELDEGGLVVEIGLAVVRPAEFVVLRIRLRTADSA